MKEDRKGKLSTVAVLLGLILLSVLLLLNLNSLSFPVAPNLGLSKNVTSPPNPTIDGLLLITTQANLTVVPANSTGSVRAGTGGFYNSPLAGVLVSISDSNSSSMSMFSNFTSTDGKIALYLAPATYQVSFLDWRLNYSAVNVQVLSGQVTHVGVDLNATTYPVLSFNIADPYSSGYAVPWKQMFARVPGQQSVIAQNPITYLEIANISAVSYIKTVNPKAVVPVSISENIGSQNSQWLQLQVSAPLDIGSIQNLHILSLKANYLVSVGA